MSLKQNFLTHEVLNQPVALGAYNVWDGDTVLHEVVAREGAAWAADALQAHGATTGEKLMEFADQANKNRPVLQAFDRHGRRIDQVEFHPSYHHLMREAMAAQVHSFSWRNEDKPGAHVSRAALLYLNSQADAGTACPLTMTHAVVPALRTTPSIADEWVQRVTAVEYDPRHVPAAQKTACTIGMGMTEKQGGSDVRANTTVAHPQPDGSFEIVGHKFFFSAPMCDAHLVLAQTEAGLSCFLVPRILPNGDNNAVRLQRLKDKLGDWSNASSEVEFTGATAYLVGPPGRGVATIIEMVALTRLDCMVGSSALMRQSLVQALFHTRQRKAFGRVLADQPLMKNVLADLALESEAATALTMRVARAVDESGRDPHAASFARVATAIGKYWVCKRAPGFVNEAQECLGGIGYVEENNLPRLYRQAPLNSIWEGSGNVQCLDVLRALQKEPEVRDALLQELELARGQNRLYDQTVSWLPRALEDASSLESRSRLVVERAGIALQAGLLLRAGNDAVAQAFCTARLGEDTGYCYGTLGPDVDRDALLRRAYAEA